MTINGRRYRKPRTKASYRSWRRNNAITWGGVEPDSQPSKEQEIREIIEYIEEKNYTKSVRKNGLSTTKEG